MFDLCYTLRLLKDIGYVGDCMEEPHLRWALRVGGVSFQFKELIWWLERKCQQIFSEREHNAVDKLWTPLRQSIMNSHNVREQSPMQFRFGALNAILSVIYSNIVNKNREDNLTAMLTKLTLKESYDKFWRVSPHDPEIENDLMVFICDQLSPTGEIANKRWASLKSTITSTILKLSSSDDETIFYEDRSDITYELRVVTCSNADALAVLKYAIGMAPALWPNAAISIMSKYEYAESFRRSAWIWVQSPFCSDVNTLLEKLAQQNSAIAVKDWSFCNYGPIVDNGQYILLCLNERSLPELKKSNCYLSFNGQLLHVRINRKLGKWFDLKSLTIHDFCE